MGDGNLLAAFTQNARRRDLMAALAKLDAVSEILTGRPYAPSAKPAPPANRAQRRLEEAIRRRQERKKRRKKDRKA